MVRLAAVPVLVLMTAFVLDYSGAADMKGKRMEYEVKRLKGHMAIDGKWDKPAWRVIAPLRIANYMGEKPEHFPRAEAKAAYDADNIYVIFRVEDRYVRAIATEYHGRVWEDSCVEFFFRPGGDSPGYFNLETNCGGTQLMNYSRVPREDFDPVDVELMKQIEVAHSLPKVVEPEMTGPVTWTLEYRLPLAILEKYCPIKRPAPGVTWRANFYKCGDMTSHPHWLTWSPIDLPQPDFHQPDFFGTLKFTE